MGAFVVVVLIFLVSLAQEMNRRIRVQREVQHLTQEVQQREKKVVALEQLNQYFRTDDFQERLAREKLNYAGPGEKVILLPEETNLGQAAPTDDETAVQTSIPERWWQVFFVGGESGLSLLYDGDR